MQKTINRILLTILVLLIVLLIYKTFRVTNKIESPVVTNVEKLNADHGGSKNSPNTEDYGTEAFKNRVEAIVKDYLINNPDIIITSLEVLQKQKTQEIENQANDYISSNKEDIEDTHYPIIGNKEGKITIVAFYDYNCIHSKTGDHNIDEMIRLHKDLRVILRPFPILGESSNEVAKIVLAVHALFPDKFELVHDGFMEMRNINTENIKEFITKSGLDYQKIMVEADKQEIKTLINKSADLAGKLKIQGVPSYIINGKLARGLLDVQQLQEFIPKEN